MVKMQVFELLTALALFDAQGHHLALDALDHYKVTTQITLHFKGLRRPNLSLIVFEDILTCLWSECVSAPHQAQRC